MKKWTRILLLLLCFGFVQATALPAAGPIVAEAAAKQGLKKEKGKYYFYSNGKKIKDKWKNISETVNGQTVKYRYYFDETGAAVAGKLSDGILTPKVKKIGGKSYGFDNNGHMVTGLYVIDGEFYLFRAKDGVYKSSVSKKLNSAAGTGKESGTLLALLAKQVGAPTNREDFEDSCYGDGKDSIVYYANFMVALFIDSKGTETVVSVSETAQKTPEDSGQVVESADTDPVAADGSAEPGADVAAGTQVNKGLVFRDGYYYYYKNGEPLKNTWKNVNGYRYYFGKKGKAKTYNAKINGKIYVFDQQARLQKGKKSRIVTIGGRKYYVSKSGQAFTGWQVVNGKLYYAEPKTGLLYQSRTYGGVKFTASGAAENTTDTKLKIKTMSVLSSITNSKMSKSQKLQACWNYIVGRSFSYAGKYPDLNASGWHKETALDMLTSHAGNCYSFACAFAALAKEVGYQSYVICGRVSGTRDGAADGMTRHAWVRIDGLGYFDPEAQYAGWYRGVYASGGYGVANQVQKTVAF